LRDESARGALMDSLGGLKDFASSPEVKRLTDDITGRLVDAGQGAALAAVTSRVDGLTSRLGAGAQRDGDDEAAEDEEAPEDEAAPEETEDEAPEDDAAPEETEDEAPEDEASEEQPEDEASEEESEPAAEETEEEPAPKKAAPRRRKT